MKYLLALVLFSLPSALVAESKPWDTSLGLGINMSQGNTDTTLGVFEASAKKDGEKNVWILESDFRYGESDDQKNTELAEFKGQYKRLIGPHLYLSHTVNALHDDIADVEYRLENSPAVGAYLVRDPHKELSIELGPSYVFEEVQGQQQDFLAGRIGERLEYRLSETAKLQQQLEAILSVEDTDDLLLDAEIAIEATISKGLSLAVTIQDKFDNQPAPGRESNDVALITSLRVKP